MSSSAQMPRTSGNSLLERYMLDKQLAATGVATESLPPTPAPSGAFMRSRSTLQILGAAPAAAPTPPSLPVIALTRAAFGPTPADLADFLAMGGSDSIRLQNWVDQQLAPQTIDDSAADTRIAASGFSTLNKPLAQLWADHSASDPPWQDRIRPAVETQLVSFIRAIYSRRQLVQVLADFWHNHFNIYGWDSWSAPIWVHWDRDVIRANSLGNFRQMIDDVSKSATMLFYLDNWINSADGPNENYARELLELHTMGDEGYYGAIPRNQVPVDGSGVAVGFVDEDVFTMARCLTGWSVAGDPWWDPKTGDASFYFRSEWHEMSSKNFLNVVLPANQPGEKDGQDVLDMLAAHPATARHVCYKLCRRLIGDFPPDSVVDAAAAVFNSQVNAPDQLAQVVRTILVSNEFQTTWGQKVKRPFEIVVSALRAGGADFPFIEGDSDTESFEWRYYNTGQQLFSWHPPNGYPDVGEAWVSSGPRVMTWRLVNWLVDVEDDAGNYRLDALAQTPPGVRSANGLVDFWIDRTLSRTIPAQDRQELVDFMAQGYNPDFDLPLDTDVDTRERLQSLLGLIFMSPEFLWR